MAKVFLFMMISLDGYFEGENHDLSWHTVDREFNSFAIPQTQSVGTLLFGRRTYELMKDYWPTADARRADPIVANLMNTTPKIVFSHSLKNVEETAHWKNVSLSSDVVSTVKKLKEKSVKDIGVYGSNNLCVTLLEQHLLDEVRIMINPVVIGKGTPLFAGFSQKRTFTLSESKTFTNGNVLLTYIV